MTHISSLVWKILSPFTVEDDGGGGCCDAKKCSFAVSILVLLLLLCSMQVSSTATAAAASDNLGKLQISTHDRRIAFFFNPPLLFSAPLLLYAMHFYRNLAYMPKSQRISDNQCTLSTLPLFSRKFKNTNEVICSNKNLRNRRRSLAAWQLTAEQRAK